MTESDAPEMAQVTTAQAVRFQSDPVFSKVMNECSQGYVFRQKLIGEIQIITGRRLVVYLSNPMHPFAVIRKEDITAFEELLRTVSDADGIDLLINSPGGDPNTAEKMLSMCRSRFKTLHVIVPDYAKSAATMVAIGSDKICMGYLAELGPIDPQIQFARPDGRIEMIPAGAFIEGLETIRENILQKGDRPEMYMPMIAQIRPEILAICRNAIADAHTFAEKWLTNFMMKARPAKAKEVATALTEGKKYKSHGKVIDFAEAKNELQLDVDLIDNKSPLWDKIWELYIRGTQFLMLTNQAKLFENEKVSLAISISVAQIPPPQKKQP